jgi:hypothetical protein
MAQKKKQSGGGELVLLAIGIIFIPFIITFGLLHYFNLKQKYLKTPRTRRVVDIWNIGVPFYSFVALVISTYMLCAMTQTTYPVVSIIILVFAIYTGVKLAQRSASCYFGAAIIPETGTVVFPEDMASYGIEDYLKLKFIRNLSKMDQVDIDEIEKITRQAGKRLFIHGPFGSRGISFTNKQKRDECYSAIQSASNKKSLLLNEMEDYD